MNRKLDPAYKEQGIYTASDLRYFLAEIQEKPVPKVTFKKWRYWLEIEPDDELLYTEFDRDALSGLVHWIRRGGRIKTYADRFLQSLEDYKNGEQAS